MSMRPSSETFQTQAGKLAIFAADQSVLMSENHGKQARLQESIGQDSFKKRLKADLRKLNEVRQALRRDLLDALLSP